MIGDDKDHYGVETSCQLRNQVYGNARDITDDFVDKKAALTAKECIDGENKFKAGEASFVNCKSLYQSIITLNALDTVIAKESAVFKMVIDQQFPTIVSLPVDERVLQADKLSRAINRMNTRLKMQKK